MIEQPPKITKAIQAKAINLLVDNKYNDLFARINREYLYWDTIKYLAPNGVEPDSLWAAVKIQRQFNAVRVKFGDYSFHYTITSQMQNLLHEFDLNFGGNLGTNSIIPQKNHTDYLVSSIMEEAIASSQMEGASTTRKVAKDMLRRKLKPKNKGQQMILNNYNTIQYIIDHQNDDFSIEKILEVHRYITSKTLDDSADEGRIRTEDNVYVINTATGDVAHTPPSHTKIESLLEAVCEFANHDIEDPFIHPIIKAIIIHFLLSFIHPFVDGNGRTARSLFYWYMLKKGYWLTEYLSISRIIYKSKASYEKSFLYVENDGYDLSYFNHYNLKTMRSAYEELKSYLQRKVIEQERIFSFDPHYNINERQARLIWIIHEKPQTLFTVNELTLRFGITPKTARTDLKRLVDLNLLSPVPINKRTTGYKKSEQFDVYLKKLITV